MSVSILSIWWFSRNDQCRAFSAWLSSSASKLRQRLRLAQIAIFRQSSQAIIITQGYDAAGKGGVIRERSYALDPRGFKVHPIGPPSKT